MRPVVLAVFALVGLAAWGQVPVGAKVPELALPSTAGPKVTIGVAGARALVLLYLRADHDKSERALLELVKLHAQYKGKGARVLAVSTARADAGAVRALAKKHKVPFPVLLDEKEELAGRFGVFVHPATGVVDAKGVLRYEYSSYRADYAITVERQLRAVLGLGPPPEKIVDVDRNAGSAEELKKQRREKLAGVVAKLELVRARRRLIAVRGLVDAERLPTVLKLYAAWAEKLPLPADERLGPLAAKVRARQDLKGAAAKLAALGGGEAQLWLGRAFAAQGRIAEARAAFGKCLGQKALGGQCELELARLLAGADAAAAALHCKKGLALLEE